MKTTVFLTGATGTMGWAGLKELLAHKENYNIRILARPSKKNRRKLAGIESDVDIVARGFNMTDEVHDSIIRNVYDSIAGTDFDKVDVNDVAKNVKRGVRKLFARDREFPIIIPVIIEN